MRKLSNYIGEQIKQAREKMQYKKIDLARKLKVSAAYIGRLENGEKTNPSYLIKLNINQILGTEIYDIPNVQTIKAPLSEYSTKELLQEILRRENEDID